MAPRKSNSPKKRRHSDGLFKVLMPNGKLFGDCTFGEIGDFGEKLKRLANTPVRELSLEDKLFMGKMLLVDQI